MKARAAEAELRDFGIVVGTIFGIVFGLAGPWVRHKAIPLWPWIVAFPLLSLAFVFPKALYYPHLVWERLGKALGWVNSRIVLNLIFFVIFVPAGLIAKLFGWDPLNRNFNQACQSYRIPSRRRPRASMEKPY